MGDDFYDTKSLPAPDFFASFLETFNSMPYNRKYPNIEQAKKAVMDRIAEHSGHTPTFEALSYVDWAIRYKCKPESRLFLLAKLVVMPITDVIELSYLIAANRYLRNNKKYFLFYHGLRVKNYKNRFRPPFSLNVLNIPYFCELPVMYNPYRRYINTSVQSDTSEQSNFLLDFGFVESVGSVLLLLKDY